MLYFFRLLLILIHVDQETVLNWFGMEDPNNPRSFSPIVENEYILTISDVEVEPSTNVSLETLKLMPGYEKAIEQIRESIKQESSETEKVKSLEEISD